MVNHRSGKVRVMILNEGTAAYNTMYDQPSYNIDSMECSKRAATERELNHDDNTVFSFSAHDTSTSGWSKAAPPPPLQCLSMQFDGKGRRLLLPSVICIKVVVD